MPGSIVHEELSREIIGAGMEVLNELKPGLDERLYENALAIELRHRGHRVEQQRRYPVRFRKEVIGVLVPDMIVDERVIVDPKVARAFNEDHLAQMIGYLTISELELAILLNFKYARLKWKRVVKTWSEVGGDQGDES